MTNNYVQKTIKEGMATLNDAISVLQTYLIKSVDAQVLLNSEHFFENILEDKSNNYSEIEKTMNGMTVNNKLQDSHNINTSMQKLQQIRQKLNESLLRNAPESQNSSDLLKKKIRISNN